MAISYFLKQDVDTPAYNQDLESIFKRFQSSELGLSTESAKVRLKTGANIVPKQKLGFYQKYIKPVVNLMMLILFLAALVQTYFQYTYGGGSYFGPIVIVIILLINLIVGMRQQYKAEKTLEALERLTAFVAKIFRDGKLIEIPADQIAPGDIMILSQGDYISADGRLIEVNDFSVNESILTGEIVPVVKHSKVIGDKNIPIQEQLNMVFSSTFVASGNATVFVTGTGAHSEIGKISKGVSNKQTRDIPLQKQMNQTGTGLGLLVLLIVISLFIVQYARFGSEGLIEEINWLISLAVAAIPFNFPIITTLILLTGVMQLAKKQAIVRNLNAVETMGRLTYICTDKTGTLTKNEMTVERIFQDSKMYMVSGKGYLPEGKISHSGEEVDVLENLFLWKLIMSGAINNNAHFTEEEVNLKNGSVTQLKVLGMPTEGALLTLAKKAGINTGIEKKNYEILREFSFSSERKRMSKIVRREGQTQIITKGAVEVLLESSNYIIKDGQVYTLTDEIRQDYLKRTRNFAKDGLRTLGFSYANLDESVNTENLVAESVEKNMVFLGIVGIADPPRDGVPEAVEACQRAGIKVTMITGDHPSTALAIAKQTKIFQEGDLIATGNEIKELDAETIMKTSVFSRVAPEDKEIIVKALQSKNQIVAMTGDGVNDTLALENADVGIAMGLNGTDVAKNAADLVLTDDSFNTIASALYHGRGLFTNIRSNIVFLLVCNLTELAVLTTIALWYNGAEFLNSFQLILLYGTIHFFPPIGLIFDKYSTDLMDEPPKKIKEPLINHSFKTMMVIQIMTITFVLIGIWYAAFNGFIPLNEENLIDIAFVNPTDNVARVGYAINGEWVTYDGTNAGEFIMLKARTMCFITLFLIETWIALESRSNKRSILKNQFNIALTIMLSFALAILIFITSNVMAQSYLNLLPLNMMDWALCIGGSLVFIVVSEIFKFINR
ncbi:MAG: cation-translocating P-type ATPase, partial [Promethearchaeota archaeon]